MLTQQATTVSVTFNPLHFKQIQLISQKDKLPNLNELLEKIVELGIQQYFVIQVHRNGAHCQCCGTWNSRRKSHNIVIGFDTFVIGDCCFNTDKYKEFVTKFI